MTYTLSVKAIGFSALFVFFNLSAQALPDLTLGKAGLKQHISSTELAPGLTFHKVIRGHLGETEYFTLSSGIVSLSTAKSIQSSLAVAGYDSFIEKSPEKGPKGEELGVIVRTGKFDKKSQAVARNKELSDRGIEMAVRFTAEDGKSTEGPFQISLLEMDMNEFQGQIISALGQEQIRGKEFTSAIADRHKAVAGVNAGFFAWNTDVGTPGDLAGISVIDGRLVSEATAGRPVLLFQNTPELSVRILHGVTSHTRLEGHDFNLKVQGLNRSPGKVLNCGEPDDPKLTRAAHDHVCHNPNEIVVFTPDYGQQVVLPKGELVVVEEETITAIHSTVTGKNVAIPSNGFLVHFSGNKERSVTLSRGTPMSLNYVLESEEGSVRLRKGDYAFNGGPTLLRDGQLPLSARAIEGWDIQYKEVEIDNRYVDKKDKAAISNDPHSRAGFYHGWVVRRHPRTAVGITDNNKIYIAVVYGRQPGTSAGASVTEMAQMLKQLGATNAFNLDGGGSSMMVVNGSKTGKSSDKEGERAVGDALLIIPQ